MVHYKFVLFYSRCDLRIVSEMTSFDFGFQTIYKLQCAPKLTQLVFLPFLHGSTTLPYRSKETKLYILYSIWLIKQPQILLFHVSKTIIEFFFPSTDFIKSKVEFNTTPTDNISFCGQLNRKKIAISPEPRTHTGAAYKNKRYYTLKQVTNLPNYQNKTN